MSEFMHHLTDTELLKMATEADERGDYTEARKIIAQEMAHRAMRIQEIGVVDQPYLVPDEYFVPTDPMDDLQCESCQ